MRNKKFDVDKFVEEADLSLIDTSFWDASGNLEPKIRLSSKCPVCGSIDWWDVKRDRRGRIISCSECDSE